jgi:hypothetical protein
MPFVNGSSLEQIVRDPFGAAGTTGGDVLKLVSRSGRLLARFHRRYLTDMPQARDEAWRHLDSRTKGLFGFHTSAHDVATPAAVSRTFGDFHPGHIIVARDGRLAALDPTMERHYSFVARDIACFLDRLLLTQLSPRSAMADTRRIRQYTHEELSAAFLRGYDEGSARPLSAGDRVAVDVYLAFLLKRRLRRIEGGRWARLLYYACPLIVHYLRIMRKVRAVPQGLLSKP